MAQATQTRCAGCGRFVTRRADTFDADYDDYSAEEAGYVSEYEEHECEADYSGYSMAPRDGEFEAWEAELDAETEVVVEAEQVAAAAVQTTTTTATDDQEVATCPDPHLGTRTFRPARSSATRPTTTRPMGFGSVSCSPPTPPNESGVSATPIPRSGGPRSQRSALRCSRPASIPTGFQRPRRSTTTTMGQRRAAVTTAAARTPSGRSRSPGRTPTTLRTAKGSSRPGSTVRTRAPICPLADPARAGDRNLSP